MKYTAATIAASLKRQGISISKRHKDVRIDGIEVFQLNNTFGFEYRNWTGKANREEEIEKILIALNAIGLKGVEVEVRGQKTGAYRILKNS